MDPEYLIYQIYSRKEYVIDKLYEVLINESSITEIQELYDEYILLKNKIHDYEYKFPDKYILLEKILKDRQKSKSVGSTDFKLFTEKKIGKKIISPEEFTNLKNLLLS